MNKIEIKDLCLVFGKDGCVIAVNNVNLSIQEGEIFVIMGLSGSGKSTLLRCINGLKHRTSGEISINGTNITETSKKELIQMRRKVLAMVFLLEDILPLLTRTNSPVWVVNNRREFQCTIPLSRLITEITGKNKTEINEIIQNSIDS